MVWSIQKWIALLAAVMVVTTAACASERPEPTPNLDATVEARVQATIGAKLTPAPPHVPPKPTLTHKSATGVSSDESKRTPNPTNTPPSSSLIEDTRVEIGEAHEIVYKRGKSMGIPTGTAITFLGCTESEAAIWGPWRSRYYYYPALSGRKFISLYYEFANTGVVKRKTPRLGAELLTDPHGYRYKAWGARFEFDGKEYGARVATESEIQELGRDDAVWKNLLPGETVKGRVVFEVGENTIPLKVKLGNASHILPSISLPSCQGPTVEPTPIPTPRLSNTPTSHPTYTPVPTDIPLPKPTSTQTSTLTSVPTPAPIRFPAHTPTPVPKALADQHYKSGLAHVKLGYVPFSPASCPSGRVMECVDANFHAGIQEFTQAIQLDPGNALYYYQRGFTYYSSTFTEYEAAIRDFTQAIRLDPDNALAYYQRGRAYADRGNALQGLKDWDVACGLEILDQIQSYCAKQTHIPTPMPTATPAVTPKPTSTPAPVPTPLPAATPTPVPQTKPDVVIECIFFDGLVTRTESDEFVQIINRGSGSADMRGWSLRDASDGSPTFTFPSYSLAPSKSIRVYTNEVRIEWGGFSFAYGRAIWNNSNPDVAALSNAQGQEVSRKSYPPGC